MYNTYMVKLKNAGEIKEDLNKQKDRTWSGVGRLNTGKTLIFHKLIYTFNAISTKILIRYFVGICKIILKLIWQGKGSKISLEFLKNITKC